jgi:GPH family glycoside/pentoside/hexuronide:cation symporter
MVKFGTAVAGLISGLILSLVSFQSNAPAQTDETMFWLRVFFVGIPILGTLTALWAMKDYDIDEAKAVEVRNLLDKRKAPLMKQSSSYQSGKLSGLLHNSNLNKIVGIDYSNKSETEIASKFAEVFNLGLNGMCFSPYMEGQKVGDILSEKQIARRLDIIAPYTKWIRTFSCIEGNELIPEIARHKGIKSIVGAWISNDKERNEKEISALIKLANAGLVDIAAVGNEVLLREELSEEELIGYINRVKAAIPSHIELGYVDAYYQFIERPKLIDACDLVLCNFYPFWEGVSIDYSMSYLNNMFELTKASSKGKRIIITETGWPSAGEIIEGAVPSEINAMKYFIVAQEWASHNQIETFHFSSFDESWKVMQEGKLGSSWGLWDKNEKFKYKK